jgi:hypothetical protein
MEHQTPLAAWESFYVVVGSSAAALIGLQFIVIVLLTEIRRRGSMKQIDAFATPTILHFSAVLLLSAIVNAPWPSLASADIAIGLCGAAGVTYGVIVVRRAKRQTGYDMVLEDWIWHTILPLIAYAGVAIAAVVLRRQILFSLFVVGGSALLLLFIGIHNAWDTVTYLALDHLRAPDTHGESSKP